MGKLPFAGTKNVVPMSKAYAGEAYETPAHEASENRHWEQIEHMLDCPPAGTPMDRGGRGTPVMAFGSPCPKADKKDRKK